MRATLLAAGLLALVAATDAAATPLVTLTDLVKQCRRDLKTKLKRDECDPAVLTIVLAKLKDNSGTSSQADSKRNWDEAEKEIKRLIDGVPLYDAGAGTDPLDEAAGVHAGMLSPEKFDPEQEKVSGSPLRGLLVDISVYLEAKDVSSRQKLLAKVGDDILLAHKKADSARGLALFFSRRFDDYLMRHRQRERFVALRIATIDGRLMFSYALKDGALFREDLGPLADWFIASGGGGAVAASEAAKPASGSAGDAGAAGAAQQAASASEKASKSASSLAKALGVDGGGGGGGGGGAAGGPGGNSFGGANPFGRLTAFHEPSGQFAGRAPAAANPSRPSARAGRGLSPESTSTAPSSSRSTAVPMPKAFSGPQSGGVAAKGSDTTVATQPPTKTVVAKGGAPAAAQINQPFGPIKAPHFPTQASASAAPIVPVSVEKVSEPRSSPDAVPETQKVATDATKTSPPRDALRDAVADAARAQSQFVAANYGGGPIVTEPSDAPKSRSFVLPLILAVIGVGLEGWRRKIVRTARPYPWRFDAGV